MLAELLAGQVAQRRTPGGMLVVADANVVVARLPFGVTQLWPEGVGVPVTPEVVYDVASLTKPVATIAILARMIERGALGLDDPVRRWIPELTAPEAASMRIRHLAGHASGLPAHVPFFERLRAGERAGATSAREAILCMAAAAPIAHEPGSRTLYSDLGFILLGFVLERVADDRLDRLAARLVFTPLGMTASSFVDLEAQPPAPRPEPVAPTEDCPYRGLLAGEVHDDNTHAAGGILGQAGLFATADDVARFAIAVSAAAAGAAEPPLSSEVVRELLGTPAAPGSTWRLGWDTPDPRPGASQAGDLWPRDGVGHLGFTGCSMWLDPPRGRVAVLLTNAIHPRRDADGVRAMRREVMDGVVRWLDARPAG